MVMPVATQMDDQTETTSLEWAQIRTVLARTKLPWKIWDDSGGLVINTPLLQSRLKFLCSRMTGYRVGRWSCPGSWEMWCGRVARLSRDRSELLSLRKLHGRLSELGRRPWTNVLLYPRDFSNDTMGSSARKKREKRKDFQVGHIILPPQRSSQ